MKNFLTIGELDPKEIESILELSLMLHETPEPLLQGKTIGFVFEKPSLRTKIGTEVAINRLGGNVVHIEADLLFANGKAVPFTSRESLQDAMMNVSQWCDALFARVYSHTSLQKMAEYGTLPIINALCNLHHPMQALADLLTIRQQFPGKEDVTISFVGDANNVAFSLTEIALKMGYHMRFSGPENYFWSQDKLNYFSLLSVEYGGSFKATFDPYEAIHGSDIIYTDTFISMGEEHLYEDKIMHFEPYQVNEKLFTATGKSTGFMHCLPAHRGIEVTDAVIDHPRSWIYQQAKNRMIVSMGLFTTILNNSARS